MQTLNRMQSRTSRILSAIATAERCVATLALGLLTVIMFLDVGMREIAGQGVVWAQKFSLHLMFWAGMLGATMVSAKGGHLRPEIADKIWPQKWHGVLRLAEHLLIAVFCLLMSYMAALFVAQSLGSAQRHPVTGIPIWILQCIIPYTFFSMGFRHSVYALIPALRPLSRNEAAAALDAQQDGD